VPLAGRLFNGVVIYFGRGEQKALGFTALGGSAKCATMPSGKGVLVRYPNGREEWKDRDALILADLYFIRADDPNRDSFLWSGNLPGCP
jgi:hypothetical protein